ncbi:MAG: alpha/beta fold hydrolase [Candidatus Binatus sp.]|jgi:pimeloyl-ACP methyl ester carboxylesterase|uniref:esterase/lipase family protein n=1 Tax=Candidatus Binatus sp. TaxID=2811406 RepID=UPI003D11F425
MRNIDAVRGLKDLFVSALNGGTTTVEEFHAAIARRPFEALELDPVTRVPAAAVRMLHDAIAGGVYWGLRSLMELAGDAADWALIPLEQTPPAEEEPLPASLDLAICALNGFMGDHLERSGNALRTRMEFRHEGRTLALDAETLRRTYPGAGRKLAVFVHGLSCNEQSWRFFAEETYGDRETTYGSLLEQDRGYTPLYLRYNSGLHVSENGALLAETMEELVNAWPVAVDEIVLVGHSMGGLVARSACHQGKQRRNGWIGSVRHIFCLGTPHLGAPLEKLSNLMGWALNVSDLTRPIANIVNGRSDGIKDLRFGYLVEEDWRGRDANALLEDNRHDIPFLDSAAHYFVAATVTQSPIEPLGFILGDMLVRFPSAVGRGVQPARHVSFRAANKSHLGMTTHLRLLNHPAVYDQIRFWLEPAATALTTLADTQ